VKRLSVFFRNIFPLRPLRMYRRWRPAIADFASDELLYRRHRRSDVANGVILPSALPSPRPNETSGPSVNRSLFSKPEDTLWTSRERLDGLGVFEFPTGCLPQQIVCANSHRTFLFCPKHVPLKNNYAHTEIWCNEPAAGNINYTAPTRLAWKEVRATIQKNSQIVIAAAL
jgi:hypothetical protein